MATQNETTFKFRLSRKQLNALEAYAKQQETTKTEILRDYIKSLPTYSSYAQRTDQDII